MAADPRRKTVPESRTAYFSLRGEYRRRMFVWSAAAVALAAAWLGVRWLGAGPMIFQNGPLIAAHQRVASDCAACHGEWGQWSVTRERCLNCHFDEPHPTLSRARGGPASLAGSAPAAMPASEAGMPPRATRLRTNLPEIESCQACHREHRGTDADLTRVADARCQRCHQIDAPDRGHPEFALVANREVKRHPGGTPESSTPQAVAAQGPGTFAAHAKQRTGLSFSHASHLRELIGEKDPQDPTRKLDCFDCHALSSSGVDFEPPRFDVRCGWCHAHKLRVHYTIPPTDWSKLRADYADQTDGILLSDGAWLDLSKRLDARIAELDQAAEQASDKTRRDAYEKEKDALDDYVNAVRGGRAAKDVEPIAKCRVCHTFFALPGSSEQGVRIQETVYRQRWFGAARFNHLPHMHHLSQITKECEQCHAFPADATAERAAVFLPGVARCGECHRSGGTAPPSCITCHDYHRRRERYGRTS